MHYATQAYHDLTHLSHAQTKGVTGFNVDDHKETFGSWITISGCFV